MRRLALLVLLALPASIGTGCSGAPDGSGGPAALPEGADVSGGSAHSMHGSNKPRGPVRVTMEELHAMGGVPKNWSFSVPPGDPEKGRDLYAAMECHACHAVEGEDFPGLIKTPIGAGPDLSGMGRHHPAEYFAEAILNPNAVIVTGEGYTSDDDLSIMPEYDEAMTLRQLIDLVAYLKSLRGAESHEEHAAGMGGMEGMPAMPVIQQPPEPPRTGPLFEIDIRDGRVASGPEVIRVTRGDYVTLSWTTDSDTIVHLHGYDLEQGVTSGEPSQFWFHAYATGRFPVTSHGFGGMQAASEEEEITLLYVEVHPR